MILRRGWHLPLLLLLGTFTYAMSTDRRLSYVARAKAMFRHALDGYMDYAFPLDELNPISCTGRSVDRADQNNWNINDVLGNFSVTLVDSLDAIYTVLGPQEFHEAVRKVIDVVSFDQDSRVQVFEVTIRMLGGLVSAHHLASTPFHTLLGSTDSHLISSRDRKVYGSMPGYNGELLKLAEDLGERLLPAFDTTTGLPFPRVHLRKGVLPWEVSDTCTAGAGTLLMEFGALSRLYNDTGYQIFEKKAKHSLEYIWSRRSPLNLLGNTIDTASGVWLQKLSGIGAGADSFYEYLLKSYILFGDDTLHKTFQDAYTAVQLYNKDEPGWFYKNVDMDSGNQVVNWVDSLSAFWPGLQVLAGDVDGAVKLHFVFWSIWNKFKAFPERYDFAQRVANIGHYPLRPELIESTYFLYQATKNPFYLEVGAQILEDLESQTKTSCGFAAMQSVGTKNLDPRMESFFLSETLKYLYLLFDTENIFNKHQTNFIYTTEGHVLPIHPISRSRNKPIPSSPSKPPIRPLTCPLPSVHFNYHLPTFTGTHAPLPISEIQAINQMLGLHTYASFNLLEEPTTCKQNHTLVVPGSPELVQESDVIVSAPQGSPESELVPLVSLSRDGKSYRLNTLHNTQLSLRLDASAAHYTITKFTTLPQRDVYTLPPDTQLTVSQSGVSFLLPAETQKTLKKGRKGRGEALRVLMRKSVKVGGKNGAWVEYPVYASKFSKWIGSNEVVSMKMVALFGGGGMGRGCKEYSEREKERVKGKMVVVRRGGGCTFEEKALLAQEAGAVAVGIVNHEEGVVGMIGSKDGQTVDIPVVMIEKGSWKRIRKEVGDMGEIELDVELLEVDVEILDEGRGEVVEEVSIGVHLQFGQRPIRNLIIVGPKQ